MSRDLTLDDFRRQFEQIQKMGMNDVLGSMPGKSDLIPEGEDPEQALKRIKGIIDAMTKEERRNPDIIDISRRRRIAGGSGTEPHEIKQFLGQFDQVRTANGQMEAYASLTACDGPVPFHRKVVSALRSDTPA
jgi:signal recognition particle subunit SRP54